MSYDTYRLIHLLGLVLLALGLGGCLVQSPGGRRPRLPGILHGVGMLAMLVAGFGMLARLHINWPWPGWIFVKAGIWLVLGAMPVLITRRIVPPAVAWIVVVALAGTAIWIARAKPF